jgi:hypothetical protein
VRPVTARLVPLSMSEAPLSRSAVNSPLWPEAPVSAPDTMGASLEPVMVSVRLWGTLPPWPSETWNSNTNVAVSPSARLANCAGSREKPEPSRA